MNIKKSNGTYQVESESRKGVFYTVDANKKTCSCPGFLFYARRKGDVCKHVKAVLEYIKTIENIDKCESAKESVKKNKRNNHEQNSKKGKEINNQKKETNIEKKATEEDVLNYIRQKGEADAVELIETYGEETVNKMIQQGTVIEIKGKIKIVE